MPALEPALAVIREGYPYGAPVWGHYIGGIPRLEAAARGGAVAAAVVDFGEIVVVSPGGQVTLFPPRLNFDVALTVRRDGLVALSGVDQSGEGQFAAWVAVVGPDSVRAASVLLPVDVNPGLSDDYDTCFLSGQVTDPRTRLVCGGINGCSSTRLEPAYLREHLGVSARPDVWALPELKPRACERSEGSGELWCSLPWPREAP